MYYLADKLVIFILLWKVLIVELRHAHPEPRYRKFGNIKGHDIFIPKSTEDFFKEYRAEENTQELKAPGIIEEGDIKVTELFDELRNGKKSNFWCSSDDNWDLNAIPYVISPANEISTIIPACEAVVDVGFILDSSGSLKDDYTNEKHFLKKLAATFSISKSGSHAAVVTFSNKASLNIKLNEYFDETSFNNAVDQIPHMNSYTRIDLALRNALKIYEESNGARKTVPKLLFLITDGKHSSKYEEENPVNVANEIRSKGVDIVAIGIGKEVSHRELVNIAGSNRNVFLVEDFKELNKGSFIKRVKQESCLLGDPRNEVKLAKDNLFTTLPALEKEFSISFELKPTSYALGYHNVLRLELGNGRYIAVGFSENGHGTLVIASVLSSTINEDILSESTLILNRWAIIKIYQQILSGMYMYGIEIAGKVLFLKVNANPVDFTFVTVYATERDRLSQAGYIRNIKIRNGNQGFIVKHETLLRKGAVVASLPKLEKKYVVSFNIRPTGFPNFYYNVIHLIPANDNFGTGNENPAIWFNKDGNGKLNLASLTNKIHACTDSCLAFNIWSKLTLSQVYSNGKYVYTIKLNGNVVHSENKENAVELENVKVFAGSPEYPTQSGLIRNFVISNGNNVDKSIASTCGGLIDIGFLLDSSAIMKDNFVAEKNFVKKLARILEISKDGTHLGVISFSSEAKLEIKLSDYQDISTFESAVDAIPLMKMQIRLDKALRLAQKEMFNQINGGRENIPKILILITGGKQEAPKYGERVEKPESIALEMREKGVSIITIGVGSNVDKSEMSGIAGNIDKVFAANNFQDLLENDFLVKVKKASCGADLKDEQPLRKGKLLTILPKFSKQYTVMLEVKPVSYSLGAQSVLHFSVGEGNGSHGIRIFGVWFSSLLGHFVVGTEMNKNKNFHYSHGARIPLNKWLEVAVSQYQTEDNTFTFEVKLDGKQVYAVVNNFPVEYNNVKVYASDPYSPPLVGSMRNFSFSNGDVLEKVVASNNIVQEETPLKSGKLLATIPKLEKEYEISFEVKPENSKNWYNIFQIMQIDDKSNKYDQERLAIWTDEELKGRITSGLNNNFIVNFPESFQLQKWTNIRISQQHFQGKFFYEVEFNGKEIFSFENPDPKDFTNLKVFVSSPFHDTIPASLQNFVVINGHDDIELRKVVRAAINDFHDFTPVRFVPHDGQLDHLYFESTEGCHSKIGRVGGEQPISVGQGCRWKGTVTHLIMHALGFLHETSRTDRDEAVEVNYANMDPKMAINFRKYNAGQKLGQLYDYSSIMHYRALAFSNNGLVTITPISPFVKQDDIGQRFGFSSGDIRRINEAFKGCVNNDITDENPPLFSTTTKPETIDTTATPIILTTTVGSSNTVTPPLQLDIQTIPTTILTTTLATNFPVQKAPAKVPPISIPEMDTTAQPEVYNPTDSTRPTTFDVETPSSNSPPIVYTTQPSLLTTDTPTMPINIQSPPVLIITSTATPENEPLNPFNYPISDVLTTTTTISVPDEERINSETDVSITTDQPVMSTTVSISLTDEVLNNGSPLITTTFKPPGEVDFTSETDFLLTTTPTTLNTDDPLTNEVIINNPTSITATLIPPAEVDIKPETNIGTTTILPSLSTPVLSSSAVTPAEVTVINDGIVNTNNNKTLKPNQFPCWPFDFTLSPSVKPCCNSNSTQNCKCHCISIFINEAAGHTKRNFLCHKKTIKNPGFVLSDIDKYPVKDCVLLPIEPRKFLCYSREPGYKLRWSSNPHAKNCIQYTLGSLKKSLCGSHCPQ